MKKIIQIIPNLSIGGAEIMLENLSYELKNNNKNVVVISLYNDITSISKRLEENGISVIYLNKKIGLDFKIVFDLYKIFKKIEPDIVHTHLNSISYGMLASILSGVKRNIHTVHNIATKETSKLKRKFNSILYKYFNVTPVGISPKIKESIIEEYNLDSDRVPMIYNGIDVTNIQPKLDYKIRDKRINILHIGNFKTQKNHIEIIRNFEKIYKKNSNIYLYLAGDGNLKSDIQNRVEQLEIKKNVVFLGTVPNIVEYLDKYDLFILPSLWEGMPISLIEAMAAGLPIIASKVGGVSDMIQHNCNGILIKSTGNDLSKEIIHLSENYDKRKKIGENALKSSSKFSESKMCDEYLKIYKG